MTFSRLKMESDQQEELNEEEKEELLLQKQRKLLSDVLQQQGSQFVIKSYISAGSFGSVFLLEKQGE